MRGAALTQNKVLAPDTAAQEGHKSWWSEIPQQAAEQRNTTHIISNPAERFGLFADWFIFPSESTQKWWCYLCTEKHKDLAFCFQLDNLPGHQYLLKHLKQFIYSLYSLKRKQPLKAELHSIITPILCIWHSEEPKLNTTEHLKCIHEAMKVELTPN